MRRICAKNVILVLLKKVCFGLTKSSSVTTRHNQSKLCFCARCSVRCSFRSTTKLSQKSKSNLPKYYLTITNFPDDSGRQSCSLFCIVAENHKLVTELREVSLDSLSGLGKGLECRLPVFHVETVRRHKSIYQQLAYLDSLGDLGTGQHGLCGCVPVPWQQL